MQNLDISGTKYTMDVRLDADTGRFSMTGNSYPEDANSFFDPIYKWIETYIDGKKGPILLDIRLNYVNSSSSKCFIDLFDILNNYHEAGGEVVVQWFYQEGDDEICDAGGELLEDVSFPYKIVGFEE